MNECIRNLCCVTALGLAFASAPASGWELFQFFSNADGSIQFIEFIGTSTPYIDYNLLDGKTLTLSDGHGAIHRITFPSNLPFGESGDFLATTQRVADANVVKPDYIIPDGFLFAPSGTITVENHSPINYVDLPTDGVTARNWALWDEAYGPPYLRNAAGDWLALPGTIEAGFTGSWYDPAQNGHGFALEVLPGQPMQLLASWFTFAPQGGQAWIVGLGQVNGNQAVVQAYQSVGPGGRFPPKFDAANVHPESWGTLTFTFSDCDHGHVDWVSTAPGYGSGGMDLTRLTLPAGLTCR